jgi:drug/metabolite transporter (DMT)-like permease
VCAGIGIALLYHALSIGKMGVVSPITAVLAAALPLVAGVVRGDRISALQFLGIALAFIAIVLISVSFEEGGVREISTKGVKEAIASGVIIGGFFLFISFSSHAAGLTSLVTARLASIGILTIIGLSFRASLMPPPGTFWLVLFTGAIDMTANALFVLATYAGYLSIAAVLTSLYPASTVFLARLILNERLMTSQKVGVGLALAGVALIAFRS